MPLKLTTWNLEHSDRPIGGNPSSSILERRSRILATLDEIDPDILCIIEGPVGEQGAVDLSQQVFDDRWKPVMFKGPNDDVGASDGDYEQRHNSWVRQWVWFFVKDSLLSSCRLQLPSVWQSFVGHKRWRLHFWGQQSSRTHGHYRHPQVMILDLGTAEIEFVGVHLKSKINKKTVAFDANGDLTGTYVDEGMQARIKLATEARHVRAYVDAKFAQVEKPGIVICGDCNDGPGHDWFEERYLFFEMIGNLQGEVLMAERFFNLALFDCSAHLRWTAKFEDKVLDIDEEDNPLLIDHILVSQPLCRGDLPLVVNERAGLVEHEAFERHNAGASSTRVTSDHRPVSCVFSDSA